MNAPRTNNARLLLSDMNGDGNLEMIFYDIDFDSNPNRISRKYGVNIDCPMLGKSKNACLCVHFVPWIFKNNG